LNKTGLLKKNFLLFVLIISSIIAKAQGDYNFMPFGVGGGAGIIRGYTNVAKQNNTIAGNLNFTYYESPYLPIEFEIQKGRLTGGDVNTDRDGRQYENNYLAAYVHFDLQLGQVINYYYSGINQILKNAYFGAGVGFVDDNVNNIRVQVPGKPTPDNPGGYVFFGKDKSVDFAIPLRAGYEFKIYNEYDEPFMAIDISYTHTYVFAEGLDGYDDPPSRFKNNNPDQYRQVGITVKYNFGLIRAFTKRIRRTGF
jgi:hypothetical protein